MNKLVASSLIALAALGATAAPAAGITRNTLPATNGKPARILESVEVPAGATTLYVSGQLASPIDPSKPATTIADFGDTKTQALSTLNKIKKIVESHGYAMSDIIKMTLFLAPDPKLGKMDFDGVNAAFETFFNVPGNPNTVARSAFQVSALAGPNFLVEIEVTAAKVK
ncbi:RidA family protein [Sphingomonas sp. BIUV-7]|uniref:RidA family protein n=1 Tax=Sphingomonas natans TaxID=3063330 RepID=A0ABT8Y3Z0_9SPHN|nr:RidA family protein [Sphingomonas sp. BIUV-7]MDO6413033.1 RidA family protein [Sphingomonas sp. BIUV-7]